MGLMVQGRKLVVIKTGSNNILGPLSNKSSIFFFFLGNIGYSGPASFRLARTDSYNSFRGFFRMFTRKGEVAPKIAGKKNRI